VRALGILQDAVLRGNAPGRTITVCYWEGGHQAAAWLCLAQQHVSDRVTAFLPGQADPQHRIHLVQPRHQHRSRRIDHYHRTPRGVRDRTDKIIL
jgi:hypothetical protein